MSWRGPSRRSPRSVPKGASDVAAVPVRPPAVRGAGRARADRRRRGCGPRHARGATPARRAPRRPRRPWRPRSTSSSPCSTPTSTRSTRTATRSSSPRTRSHAPASDVARRVVGMTWFSALVFLPFLVLPLVLLLVVIWKFRDRGDGRKPATFTHNARIEIIWTAIPCLALAVVALPVYEVLYFMELPPADKKDQQVITVTGKQFAWDYEYKGIYKDPTALKKESLTSGQDVAGLQEPAGADQGPRGGAQHHLAGREPRLVDPGLRREEGRHHGPLHEHLVHPRHARHLQGPVRRAVRPRPRPDADQRGGGRGGRRRALLRAAPPPRRHAPGVGRHPTGPRHRPRPRQAQGRGRRLPGQGAQRGAPLRAELLDRLGLRVVVARAAAGQELLRGAARPPQAGRRRPRRPARPSRTRYARAASWSTSRSPPPPSPRRAASPRSPPARRSRSPHATHRQRADADARDQALHRADGLADHRRSQEDRPDVLLVHRHHGHRRRRSWPA